MFAAIAFVLRGPLDIPRKCGAMEQEGPGSTPGGSNGRLSHIRGAFPTPKSSKLDVQATPSDDARLLPLSPLPLPPPSSLHYVCTP